MTQSPVFIIAEAGVNHNGERDKALALVERAAEAGADAVKFQTFEAAKLATDAAPKATYQSRHTDAGESQRAMLARLELSASDHDAIYAQCQARGIAFMSSPFDPDSLAFLAQRYEVPALKLGSGEVTNAPLLLAAARTGLPVVLSTGMATLGEIEEALGVLAFGYHAATDATPGVAAFRAAYADPAARRRLAQQVTLLHCTSTYPAAAQAANLRAMDSLAQAFGLPVGYSDHTQSLGVPAAAAARGARAIEKHFTLDRSLPGPDHEASLEPAELKSMVAAIRDVEAALGDGVKVLQPGEQETRTVARKALVAARDLPAGTVLEPADMAVIRAGSGPSPMAYWDVVGRPVAHFHAAGTPLDLAAD